MIFIRSCPNSCDLYTIAPRWTGVNACMGTISKSTKCQRNWAQHHFRFTWMKKHANTSMVRIHLLLLSSYRIIQFSDYQAKIENGQTNSNLSAQIHFYSPYPSGLFEWRYFWGRIEWNLYEQHVRIARVQDKCMHSIYIYVCVCIMSEQWRVRERLEHMNLLFNERMGV